MSSTITFGIEIEALVAYTTSTQHLPHRTDGRNVKFEPVPLFFRDPREDMGDLPFQYAEISRGIRLNIARTMKEAGFPIDPENLGAEDITKWDIVRDGSIVDEDTDPDCVHLKDDDDLRLKFAGLEIKTPALPFTPGSLEDVERLIALLHRNYLVSSNESCGLHVHVGHETRGFTFNEIQKLLCFLYTFQPQIDSIHPIHRRNTNWARHIRDSSKYTHDFKLNYGVRPNPLTVVTHFLSIDEAEGGRLHLINDASHIGELKQNIYNMKGVEDPQAAANGIIKPTIEFRQHAGSVDARQIITYVKTIVGIITFVETAPQKSFFDLVYTALEAEEWEKLADGKNKERQYAMGPILAEHGFTIVDLLKQIGHGDCAAYYKTRWMKHDIPLSRIDVVSRNGCEIL